MFFLDDEEWLQERQVKTHRNVGQLQEYPGYFSILPPKSSHAIMLALEVANILIVDSVQKGTLREKSKYVNGVLSGEYIAYLHQQ